MDGLGAISADLLIFVGTEYIDAGGKLYFLPALLAKAQKVKDI